ncbi:MAG: Uma2 family endonuclease [Cyanobacteria bacterium CRU_2_1]|nr:Uma2 family endonuclease [Cyanobacteria bacterium RU_5_0]NJR59868.1 Uma2 family endonuclease [Cyanobacteria bacterium CRU_2_1]
MVQPLIAKASSDIIYPDSDGQLMADNTKQFRWIVVIKENLELLFANQPDVFVAGDLLWYPIEGNNTTRQAPDTMVVFGRPKGDRGSYKQWKEDNIPPQVVFEILSPGNRLAAMAKKLQFYRRWGVEEYYVYDPDDNELIGWARSNGDLEVIDEMAGWVSPRLQIRFEPTSDMLKIYRPDGEPFLTFTELAQLREQERQRAEQERQRAEQERQRAEQERQRAEQERQRAEEALTQLEIERRRNEALANRLRELGVNLEDI